MVKMGRFTCRNGHVEYFWRLPEGSGWTTALTQAGISSPGIVDSFLKASHLKRTRYAHQVTAVALAKLQAEAFAQTDAELSKEIWKERMRDRCPTFKYWDTILKIELLVHVFIRAHREKTFFTLFRFSERNCSMVFCSGSSSLCPLVTSSHS